MDENPDPLSNIIQFTTKAREPLLGLVRSKYGSCHHHRVWVNEEKRSVTCRDCETGLDAFQVLWAMALKERGWLTDLEAWEAMRDSRLSDRYDAEWQKRATEVSEPPNDPETREIWDAFHAYLGDKFCAMFKRKARKITGPYWYGRDTRGCCVSLEYVRACLVPKVVIPIQKHPGEV